MMTLASDNIQKLTAHESFAASEARAHVVRHIADMMVEARKKARLTQSELSKKTGITQSVLSRIENSNNAWIPSIETLVSIADALELKLILQLVEK